VRLTWTEKLGVIREGSPTTVPTHRQPCTDRQEILIKDSVDNGQIIDTIYLVVMRPHADELD